MDNTSRMRTAISPGQWQPWTAVLPSLGLISMAKPSGSWTGKIPVYQRPFTAEASAKHCCKHPELHTTHVGTVGWELHGTSPTTCVGMADQELPWSVCQLLFFVQHFCGNICIFVATTILPLHYVEISKCLWNWQWRRRESFALKAFHNLNGVI